MGSNTRRQLLRPSSRGSSFISPCLRTPSTLSGWEVNAVFANIFSLFDLPDGRYACAQEDQAVFQEDLRGCLGMHFG